MATLFDREALISNPPFELTKCDIATLRQTDAEYKRYTWEELRTVIKSNTLDTLTRLPSDLANYFHFNYFIKSQYTSVSAFLLLHKLHWLPDTTIPEDIPKSLPLQAQSPMPFENEEDCRILRNDWPYGMEEGIWHLVVWLKNRTETDELGDPTGKARARIENFLEKRFRKPLREESRDNTDGEKEVMWFRNRTAWQSVRALEHIHVLIRGANDDLVRQWTGQDEEDMEVRMWKDGKRIKPI